MKNGQVITGPNFDLMKSAYADGNYGYRLHHETKWHFGHGSLRAARVAAKQAHEDRARGWE